MENSTYSKKDRSDRKESKKPKNRRQPEKLGVLAITSEQDQSRWRFEKPVATGHVGAAALLAESKPVAKQAGPAATESMAGKSIETLSRAELLSLSEKIMIDGSSLGQIYETHLVGEHGLRRLVAEHIRGGDLKKALRREIVERQIDFERDPAVRDLSVPSSLNASSATQSDSAKAALDKLLKRTDLATESRSEEAAFFKARALYEADQLLQHKRQRRAIDLTVGAIILILLALILTLYMGRA